MSRKTADTGHDLVAELLRRGDFENATWVCEQAVSRLGAGQFEHAVWTARVATVDAERLSLGLYGAAADTGVQAIDRSTEQALKPINDLMASYPDSSATPFLRGHRLKIRQRLIQARIVASTVSPIDEATQSALVSRIAELRRDNQSLQRDVETALANLRDALDPKLASQISERERLVAELSLQRISLGLLQTELFDRSSRDYRSAAAVAEELAKEAEQQLPDGTLAHRIATRMLAEAKLRSGDILGAGELVQRQLKSSGILPPAWLAIEIRRLLASDRVDEAKSLAVRFYGGETVTADSPASPQVDDAWLQILLAKREGKGVVSRWLDTVEQRGGAFARRRAESIAIAALGVQGSGGTNAPAVSPALVAAQGEDWLRRGEPDRGARLLLAAALSETDPTKSLTIATKSAAAFLSAQNPDAAITALQAIAKRHEKSPRGAELMLQAALIASEQVQSTKDPSTMIAKLEKLLRETFTTWPQTEEAAKASTWLARILVASNRNRDAAYSSLQYAMLAQSSDALDQALEHWFAWLRPLDFPTTDEELESLGSAFDEVIHDDNPFSGRVRIAASWLMDRDRLPTKLPEPNGKLDSFLIRFAQYRRDGSANLDDPPGDGDWMQRLRWRLFRDGHLDASLQKATGTTISNWFDQSEPDSASWQNAAAKLWANPNSESIGRIKELATQGDDRKESLRKGMKWLASVQSPEASKIAITLSDRLATLLPVKSADWYEAKLQSIRWLNKIGKTEESAKRAKYVLLVQPPADPEIKQQFEAFAGGGN